MQHHFPFDVLPIRPVDRACRLSVTVPAKDEADFIVSSLEALRCQTDPEGRPLDPATYEVIVLANNCSDRTAAHCRDYAAAHPTFRLHVAEVTLPAERACVGTARRLMMDTAYRRFHSLGRPDGVICTTDADTRVHPHWIYHTLDSVARGARAVGGRILVPAADRGNDRYRKYHLQDVTYRSLQFCLESIIDPDPADPWPRHFQNFGPSTAVTAAAYARCGGIPPLRNLEDVGLALALERIDVTVTHNPRVRVYTSSRISHRVEGRAFSHQLDEWAAMTEEHRPQRVMGLENCKRLFKWKVCLRRAYRRGGVADCHHLQRLCTYMGWETTELDEQIRRAPGFGSLYQDVRMQLLDRPDFCDTDIERAIANLRDFTRSLRHHSAGRRRPGSVRAVPGSGG